jgi:hypothetical protein
MSSLKSVLCDFIGHVLDDHLGDLLEDTDWQDNEGWPEKDLDLAGEGLEQLYDELGGLRNEKGDRVRNR